MDRIFRTKLLDRWKGSSDPGWKTLSERLMNCPHGYCDFFINGNTFVLYGSMSVPYGTTPTFTIEGFALKENSRTLDLEYPTLFKRIFSPPIRPAHLSSALFNLWGVLLDSAIEGKKTNPQWKEVKIIGSHVMNADLRALLKRFRFRGKLNFGERRRSWILTLPFRE